MRLTKFTTPAVAGPLSVIIEEHFRNSRFWLVSLEVVGKRVSHIELKVKLQTRKQFCGNHPGACALSGHDKAHKRSAHMEGADWVDFNSELNSLLDRFHVSCLVYTKPRELERKLIIRKGLFRRVRYSMEQIGNTNFNRWIADELGAYENHCGSANPPVSSFPEETPGKYVSIGYDCVG